MLNENKFFCGEKTESNVSIKRFAHFYRLPYKWFWK